MNEAYTKLLERIKNCGRFGAISALLDWDQEVHMPSAGVAARAELLAMTAGLAHEELVHDKTERLLDTATAADDDFAAQTILREWRRHFDRARRIPTDLVKEIAQASSMAKDAWSRAREASDFSVFSELLTKLIELKKQSAEHIGYETEPYDALMDEFEQGARAADIEALFNELGEATASLLKRLMDAANKPDASILSRHYPKEQQAILSRELAEAIGFDFHAGRDDVSVHPFCTTIGGPSDVRITTRFQEDFFSAAIFGTLHEAGHGLYEQGLPADHRYTPMAEAVSLGIHESQSRMWENMVGRSRAFWDCHYDRAKSLFPEALHDVPLDTFYGAINTVSPSMIRVEADELTYNLHIVVRFELERGLFTGKYQPADIPAAWNEIFTRLLGITPTNDAEGCLQDIHWSMGAFGYFPTYALGNLYAAQFYAKANEDIPQMEDNIRNNNHTPLRDWLRENIHQHGQRYRAHELVERVTGKSLSIEPFMNYVSGKYGAVYGL
ncbi:MAG: carboxypeptidase M32 [Phycisphaerae bacterium]